MNRVTKDYFIKETKVKVCSKKKSMKNRLSKLSEEKCVALKIVSVYVLIVELWIIFSIFHDVSSSIDVKMIRGDSFVIVTAGLLYVTIYKHMVKIRGLKDKLQTSEERWRFVIDHTTEGLYDWNIETDEFILQSKVKSKLGYPDDKIPYSLEEWKKITHPEDVQEILKVMEDYFDKKISEFKVEYRMKKKNGEWVWVLEQGQGIWNESGKAIRMIGTITDITERKQVEVALKESEERYRRLCELLPDAINIHCNGEFLFTNDAGARLFGLEKPEDLIGKPVMDFIHDDYRQMTEARINAVQNERKLAPLIESRFIATDGTMKDVEVALNIFNYKGVSSILCVVRDITERKKTEDVLKKTMEENKVLLDKMMEIDRLKTEFFSNMSHEFKTPLNIILSMVQLLNSYNNNYEIRIDPKKFNKYIHVMKQNCYRLLRLINNLIDITRIDSGFFEINYKNHNIINILEEITLSVAEFAGNKGLSLTFNTEVEEKIMACDVDKIERIMLNLLSNAIKFTKPGGNIYVNIYDKEENIVISVKDTGIGISIDKLDKIFERFIQVDSSLHRENEGSGIGLSLVKSLIEKHEGEILAESKQGVETEFIIKLPVKVLLDQDQELSHDYYKNELVEKIHIEFSDIYA